jgi:hypothetical protein
MLVDFPIRRRDRLDGHLLIAIVTLNDDAQLSIWTIRP